MNRTIIDYITGKMIPDVGAEGSRQLFEKFLVEHKGYAKEDVRIDVPITVLFKEEEYVSTVDLIVFCNENPFMAIRCIAGSLGSYEREILAAARLVYDVQIPFSVSTNGKDALVRNVLSGRPHGEGLDAVPAKEDCAKFLESFTYIPFPPERREREMIIFRSYDIERNDGECDASPFLNGQIL
ncbi:MAG: type I restriction enzyme HsdR N-terminal domain-containing protein [Desulfamplus sp.]|nr:type I restriction enzyme HsdR N-terminal domain-containing protein [Desulfamplus sp.]MBF0259416.1 type I restriction enzyme HsdR N-terminal domain-containing protein [Desulfamplus sp.]